VGDALEQPLVTDTAIDCLRRRDAFELTHCLFIKPTPINDGVG
jgi:hypothetical protein